MKIDLRVYVLTIAPWSVIATNLVGLNEDNV